MCHSLELERCLVFIVEHPFFMEVRQSTKKASYVMSDLVWNKVLSDLATRSLFPTVVEQLRKTCIIVYNSNSLRFYFMLIIILKATFNTSPQQHFASIDNITSSDSIFGIHNVCLDQNHLARLQVRRYSSICLLCSSREACRQTRSV